MAAPEAEEIKLPVELDWIVKVINEKCDGAVGVVKSHKCERIGEGKGFLSRVTRVTFEWDPKSKGIQKLPKGVVIKKPTIEIIQAVDEMMAEAFSQEDLVRYHNQECRTYEFLTLDGPSPIPMAKHFHLGRMNNEDPDSGLIILEDLTDAAVSLQFCQDGTVEQVKNLAGHIGRLQAYGLIHADKVSEYFDKQVDNPFESMMKDLEKNLTALREQIGAERMKYSNEQILKLRNDSEAKLKMFTDPSQFGFTTVLTLGDVQPNNVLWKRDATGGPGGDVAAFIDFQLSHMGNCMNDVIFTLNQCLSTVDRREHADEIINHYLEVLGTELKKKAPGTKCPIERDETVTVANCLQAQMASLWLGFMPAMKNFMKVANIDESKFDELVDRMLQLNDEMMKIKF